MKNESRAFQEGWQVGLARKESVNPYQPDSDDYKDWDLGLELSRDPLVAFMNEIGIIT